MIIAFFDSISYYYCYHYQTMLYSLKRKAKQKAIFDYTSIYRITSSSSSNCKCNDQNEQTVRANLLNANKSAR